MALVVADRVKVKSVSNGTGDFVLGVAVLGYQDFTIIGDGNETYYGIVSASGNWEIGRGTYYSSPARLVRTTVFSSSNNNAHVNFTTGNKEVFVTLPSNEAIIGPQGLSAYDVAVSNGFSGTQSNWLASLVGPAGQDGAPGVNGQDGAPGVNGQDGAPGVNGQDGAPGVNGQDGAPGQGVPIGGTTGQVLAKVDGTDYNTTWVNQSGGGASTGNITFTDSLINTSDNSDIGVAKTIVPNADNTYDLGSPNFRFRHLYIGPGTIYIGDNTRAITATASSIDLPTGTTIGGQAALATTIQNIFNEIITNYLEYNQIIGAPTDLSDLPDSGNIINQNLVQITGLDYPVGQTFVLTSGGDTVSLTGVGFQSRCNVYLNGAPVASTSFIDSTSITFVTSEVSTPGTFQLTVINPDGTSAQWAAGLIFVDLVAPKFADPSGLLVSYSRNTSHSTTLDVIGGTAPYTFSITAGALPSGLTLNTSTGVISGTTPNVSADTVYNFIATVTDSAVTPASTSASFQIAVIVPVPWIFTPGGFNIKSNNVFFIEYEEDITNTPTFALGSFNIKSNNVFFTEYEEDITNTPTFELGSFNIKSNNVFFTEYEEDITNTPTFELGTFGVSSYIP